MKARSYLPVAPEQVSFTLDEGPDGGLFTLTGTTEVMWFDHPENGSEAWVQVRLDEPHPIAVHGDVRVTTVEVKRDDLEVTQ